MSYQEEKQKAFHSFVADVMDDETTEENAVYQSVISTVYSIIEDKNLDSLHETLKALFPKYWTPEQTAIIRKLYN